MKKILSLALILCLLLAALPLGASAYSVVLSPQNLEVDGVLYDCEKYNIDGSNYFKLRDLAVLLSGTPAQFAVSWDAEANAVVLAPGLPYESIGGELEVGEDVRAELLLGLPMNPVCRPDCKGLCPVCGVNLNKQTCTCQEGNVVTGPFSALKDYVLNNEEV